MAIACSVCYMMAFYTSVFTHFTFPSQFINLFLTFGFHLKTLIMSEDQAQVMIELLIEISNKLTDLNEKIGDDYDIGSVNYKLNDMKSEISSISINTSNL